MHNTSGTAQRHAVTEQVSCTNVSSSPFRWAHESEPHMTGTPCRLTPSTSTLAAVDRHVAWYAVGHAWHRKKADGVDDGKSLLQAAQRWKGHTNLTAPTTARDCGAEPLSATPPRADSTSRDTSQTHTAQPCDGDQTASFIWFSTAVQQSRGGSVAGRDTAAKRRSQSLPNTQFQPATCKHPTPRAPPTRVRVYQHRPI